jgi:hypothetical protein
MDFMKLFWYKILRTTTKNKLNRHLKMIYFPFVLKSSLNSTTKTKKVKIVNKTNNKHQQEENNKKK